MTSEILVQADSLVRRFGDREVVRGLSLTLRRGEILGFLGPNGAGKTTTLRMLAGVLAPSAGNIQIAGLNMRDEALRARACVGFLPETPPVNRELTVDEYLRHAGALQRLGGNELSKAISRVTEQCQLGEVSRRLIGNLSKGFQQRVGIAQAIIHAPPLVILDEPTVGLDPLQIQSIRELIASLASEHGIILSTHILPELQQSCTRVAIINNGEIVLDESLQDSQSRLRIRLARPPSDEVLKQMLGARECELSAPGEWLVEGSDDDFSEQLAKTCVEQDWGLLELRPATGSLEDRFTQLTHTETTVGAQA